jgi:hypothetical protein
MDNARRRDLDHGGPLTWEMAFALFERARLGRAGTVNYAAYLGQAAGEDSGGLANVLDAVVGWWTSESTITFCGVGCTKSWNGDPDDQFAPQENTARNGERTLNALLAVASVYPIGTPLRNGVAVATTTATRGAARGANEVFHYTFSRAVASIKREGLRAGSYATPSGALSPLQAQIDLALAPNRGLPGALLRINLAGLRQAGYEIPGTTQIGRSVRMPGGAFELHFPFRIPPEYITVIRP